MKQLARWVSILAHPFAMIAMLVAVPAMRQSSGHALQSVLLVAIIVIPIAVLMFRQVRCGRWSNVDASNPSERPVLFVVALAGLVAALGWLNLKDPHLFLIRDCWSMRRFFSFTALLAHWVKLSLHVAFTTLAATTLSLLG